MPKKTKEPNGSKKNEDILKTIERSKIYNKHAKKRI